jgi:hypothetical protein
MLVTGHHAPPDSVQPECATLRPDPEADVAAGALGSFQPVGRATTRRDRGETTWLTV